MVVDTCDKVSISNWVVFVVLFFLFLKYLLLFINVLTAACGC